MCVCACGNVSMCVSTCLLAQGCTVSGFSFAHCPTLLDFNFLAPYTWSSHVVKKEKKSHCISKEVILYHYFLFFLHFNLKLRSDLIRSVIFSRRDTVL